MLVRVGTRKSKLALTQTQIITEALKQKHPHLEFEIIGITTSGDVMLDRDLALIGGKGLFLKEIEEQLALGNIDIAVHSMKDVPAFLPEGFTIDCMYKREVVEDVYVSLKYPTIDSLPQGAIIGTSSARRKHQLLTLRPDLKTVTYRGNVPTRIEKLQKGEVDGCILALAGVKRLGLTEHISQVLPITDFLPAAAQGVIAVETTEYDVKMKPLLSAIHDQPTYICVSAERSFLQAMQEGCTTPIAAYATLNDGKLTLRVQYFDPVDFIPLETTVYGAAHEAIELGIQAAGHIKGLLSDVQ